MTFFTSDREMNVLLVFIGGGVGCALRYGAGHVLASTVFPCATLAVNAVGSFAIGLFGGWASRFGWGEGMRLMLTTGLCEGFTTFSTFSKESLALAEAGRWCTFAAYAVGSVSVGIVAVALGYWLAKN